MINPKNISGFIPTDLLLTSAINEGIKDIRANPYLLDFIIPWLQQDATTSIQYGDVERSRFKNWFLKHKIFVTTNWRTDDPKFPLVSVGLLSSVEDKVTLGDIHHDTTEEVDISELTVDPQIILGPFTPFYDQVTGLVTLPPEFTTDSIYPEMRLMSKNKVATSILEVISDQTFKVDKDLKLDFNNSYITSKNDNFSVSLESAFFKETFSIKCFHQNDANFILYLHSLIEFILLRYRESLLEARGLDSTQLTSGPVYSYSIDGQGGIAEKIWGRDITLIGLVKKSWPKAVSAKYQSLGLGGIEVLGGTSPESMKEEVKEQGWGMEGDFDSIGAS